MSAQIQHTVTPTESSSTYYLDYYSGGGSTSSLLKDTSVGNFSYQFSTAGDVTWSVTWEAPAGKKFVVTPPAGVQNASLSAQFGGGSTSYTAGRYYNSSAQFSFTDLEGTVTNGNARVSLSGPGAPDDRALLNFNWSGQLTSGTPVSFTSLTITDTIPASFAGNYAGVALRNINIRASGTASSDIGDPGAWLTLEDTGPTPWNTDSDGDGLFDAEEDLLGTDMNNPDTDGDNLSDGDEVAFGTDPLVPDTDNDGVEDGADSNPTDPEPELRARVADLTQQLVDCDDLAAALMAQTEADAAAITALEGELDAVLAETADLTAQLAANEAASALLQADLDAANALAESLQVDLQQTEQTNSLLEDELSAANTIIVGLEAQLAAANDSIAEVTADLTASEAHVADLEAQLATATDTNTALEAQLAAANEEITLLTADLTAANDQITGLTTDLAAANGQIATLNDSIAALSQSLTDSQAQSAALQTALDNANGEITDLTAALATSEADNAALQTALASSQSEVASLSAALSSANQTIDTQAGQIAGLVLDLESANNAIENLEAINAAQAARLSAIGNDLDAYEAFLRTEFRDPGFVIPGETEAEKIANLVGIMLEMNRSRHLDIYRGLTGETSQSPGGKPKNK